MKEIDPNKFFRKIEKIMLISIIIGTLLCLLIWRDIIFMLSFLSGGILGLVNFETTKREGIELLRRVQQLFLLSKNASHKKERILYIGKFYLRLFAIGIIIYFLINKIFFHPLFILCGFSLVYIELMIMSLILINKKEVLI